MKEYDGLPQYKIWLIGDSNPECEDKIDVPLDKKHPVRHNIWTSVLDEMQDYIYRETLQKNIYPLRIDSKKIYIRNAIENVKNKPAKKSLKWKNTNSKLEQLNKLMNEMQPLVIITFGQFSYEFVRRACGEQQNSYNHWTKEEIGKKFNESIEHFELKGKPNIIPLLHNCISQGDFTGAGKAFIGNENIKCSYFEYVGECIGKKLIEYRNQLDIWIDQNEL